MNATKSPLYLALIRRCERFLELVDKDAPDVVINMEVQGIQDVIEAIAKEEKKGE